VSHLTLIQCHFVRDKLNHRIRFGSPHSTLALDKYRKLACFDAGATLGYIRWRANEYGTQDWRCTQVVKRALVALDDVEKSVSGPIETLPESYWIAFQNGLSFLEAQNAV